MLDLVPDVADARAWQIVMLPDDSMLIRRKDPPATDALVDELRKGGSLRRAAGLIRALRVGGWISQWRLVEIGGEYWHMLLALICGGETNHWPTHARISMLRIRWPAATGLQVRAYLTDGQAYRNASAADVGRLITEATELAGTADRMGRWWALSDGPAAEQDLALALARRQQTLAARYQALDDQLADLLHVSRNAPCETVAPEVG